jgi:4-amino-4-deoxy-L-arabinose transferase-like glycosyltransferase
MTAPADQTPSRPVTERGASADDLHLTGSPAHAERCPWRLDLALMAGVALLAVVLRWPNLWLIPRFTDETLEVLHSLWIVRDGARPLTNYDSYYGALYNYVVALALAVSGESPLAPRVVVLLAGVATAVATYLLGTKLASRLVTASNPSGGSLAPRLSGLLAAGLLATNGPHVVVNSHIAWSNCLTPLMTTLAFWAMLRGAGRWLVLTGLLLGLALQTHPLVAALLPGVAVAVLLPDWRIVRTPWPWLAGVAFLAGYANVLAYNAEHGFESVRSALRIQAEYAQDQQAASGYAPTAGAMLLLLGRTLGGAVDQRESVSAYLGDPGVLAVVGLALVGLGILASRREPLPLLACLSFLLVLPAANPKFQALLTARYLMPIVPLLLACAALTLIVIAELARRRWPSARRRLQLGTLAVGLVLVALPTISLDRYYRRAFERTDTNERIFRLLTEIEVARRPDEIVLVDESIGAELPDTGVTELRGLEYLLTFERVPYRTLRPSPGRLQDSLDDTSTALAVLNARDASAAAGRVRVEPLDPRLPVETGRMFDFRLYRLSRDRA